MADFMFELESMAANATLAFDRDQLEIQRWQRLFGFSHPQAEAHIESHHADLSRIRVSDELWELVRAESEADGHSRESYEFSLGHAMAKRVTTAISPSQCLQNRSYIIKLEAPIESAQQIQEIAKLNTTPKITTGKGETGTSTFCIVDEAARNDIVIWIATHHPNFHPIIVRLSKSPKELSDICMAPKLGFDTTLPQHRASNSSFTPTPTQDQYPVWYFFYGNLAKSEELQRRLELANPPQYTPAKVRGGKMRGWRGKFKALVDGGSEEEEVDGSAYLVTSREQEDTLRFYETENYEVVRCDILMLGGVTPGLLFRFARGEDQLD